jgi:hypothetical protein
LDTIANKVVQKYQQSTCEQLWAEEAKKKGQPKPVMEQEDIQRLRSDPQLSNKMFACGMIP